MNNAYFVCANRMWSTDLNCFHLLVKLIPSPSSSLLGCISMNVKSCKYRPLHMGHKAQSHSLIQADRHKNMHNLLITH